MLWHIIWTRTILKVVPLIKICLVSNYKLMFIIALRWYMVSITSMNTAKYIQETISILQKTSCHMISQSVSTARLKGNMTWWRHQMETFSALLALCARNSPVTGEIPTQRPVTRSFNFFFDLRLNNRLSKHWWGWWFEKPSCPLWRHCND